MHYNDFVKFFLRSPLHGLFSKSTMLITLTGRKSGRKIVTPVSYYFSDEKTLWVISARDRTWWRNAIGGAEVSLRLRGKEVLAHAEAILDETAVATQLQDYIGRYAQIARYVNVNMDEDGKPNVEDLAREAKKRMFVKVTLRD